MSQQYLPPAGIDDFARSTKNQVLAKEWHEEVTGFLQQVRSGNRASPLFYDQLADQSGVPDSEPVGIPWNGFPLRLDKWFADKGASQQRQLAHGAAEQLLTLPVFGYFADKAATEPIAATFRVQDEYCEWFVERDAGKIARISFTCEPPEYWEFLAKHDFNLVVELYRELLRNNSIKKTELQWGREVFNEKGKQLYAADDYNPRNVWNTSRGAIHLTHPANSLFAEIALASDSSLGWPAALDLQQPIDAQALMCCAGVGGINRSSDPLILQGVYDAARKGISVALFNPIGLYMSDFTLAGLLDPDGNSIGQSALTRVRKSKDGVRLLRVEVAPPAGGSFTLDECTLDGDELSSGGQIARLITMRLFAVTKKIPGAKLRKITACPSSCCTHPTHKSFKGTFGAGTNCSKLTDGDWEREAFDIPQLSLNAGALAASEQPTWSLQPRGRKTVRQGDLEALSFEEE